MKIPRVSRRRFALVAGGLVAGHVPLIRCATLSAQDVVKRIQSKVGVDWQNTSVDGFRAGDPATPVRGIATTAMATMEVLRQASKAGLNLIVTYEPTFFGQLDGRPAPVPASPAPGGAGRGGRGQAGVAPDDPIYLAKKEFIEKNGLVVWRFRDHWKARKENDLAIGLAETLGWSKSQVKGDPSSYLIPPAKFAALVSDIKKRLNVRGGLRVLGDPQATIQRIVVLPGLITLETVLKRFPGADLVVIGETRDWGEGVEYAGDANAAGVKTGLITLGRTVSEDPGMRSCATWLKGFINEVPVQWITAGDPYWRPA